MSGNTDLEIALAECSDAHRLAQPEPWKAAEHIKRAMEAICRAQAEMIQLQSIVDNLEDVGLERNFLD